jgi:putative salt-induced outer membrane protein YdiY
MPARFLTAALVLSWVLCASSAFARQPPAAPAEPPPGTWIGTAGAGISLISGNANTVNYNVAFDVTRDPKTRNVQKGRGLFLRGEQDDELTANQLALAFRNQFALTPRAYVYGQVEYLRDTFKLIDYLVAPTAGIGIKVVDTQPTKFSVDGGLGAVWEKNPDLDVDTSLALTAGEKLEHQLTATTSLKHAATALWKADDFADGLYTVSVGVGVKVSQYLQLTVDLLDTFKNRPPNAATDKNDVAFVTALAAKF